MTYKLREDFEAWVGNQHMLNRSTAPGYTEVYEHPWTAGAWAAWQEQHNRAKQPAKDQLITKESWDNACRGLGGGA